MSLGARDKRRYWKRSKGIERERDKIRGEKIERKRGRLDISGMTQNNPFQYTTKKAKTKVEEDAVTEQGQDQE
jgi:hypothetical protein